MHTRVICVKEVEHFDFKIGETYTRLRIYESGNFCFIRESKTNFAPTDMFMTKEEFREQQLEKLI